MSEYSESVDAFTAVQISFVNLMILDTEKIIVLLEIIFCSKHVFAIMKNLREPFEVGARGAMRETNIKVFMTKKK